MKNRPTGPKGSAVGPMLGIVARWIRFGLLARRMRRDWNRRAQDNALHFVNNSRENWDEEGFFATGEENLRDQVANDMDRICQGRDPAGMRVLEIGCGVGRMTRALAGVFGEVHGVDVSEEMVRRARQFLRDVPNAHVHWNSGIDLRVLGSRKFDFAYSFIVFQHVPSLAVIDGYVGEVSRLLRRGSLFKFQVQGYEGLGASRLGRDTWLGASVSETEAAAMAARHGFVLQESAGAGTQYYWLWYFKP